MWNYGNPQKPISFGFFCTNSAGRFKTPILDLKVANQLIEHAATFVTRSSLVSISIWKHLTWLIKQSFGINVLLQWRHYGNPQKPNWRPALLSYRQCGAWQVCIGNGTYKQIYVLQTEQTVVSKISQPPSQEIYQEEICLALILSYSSKT